MIYYDFGKYPNIFDSPEEIVDRRHIYWMADLLSSGLMNTAMEIGCLNGASTTAFAEALRSNSLSQVTLCDLQFRPSLRQVILDVADRVVLRQNDSGSVLGHMIAEQKSVDFLFVDGDHSLNAGCHEAEFVRQLQPWCVMAHDSSTTIAKPGTCEGPAHFKSVVQREMGYYCLEDNERRPGEETWRGMFLATRSLQIYDRAKRALTQLQQDGDRCLKTSS